MLRVRAGQATVKLTFRVPAIKFEPVASFFGERKLCVFPLKEECTRTCLSMMYVLLRTTYELVRTYMIRRLRSLNALFIS